MRGIGTSGGQAIMMVRQFDVKGLEGRIVNVLLADATVLDRVPLVLARRNTLWVVVDGEDEFVPLDRVVGIWAATPLRAVAVSAA